MFKSQSNTSLMTIFMKDLILEASIGIYDHEKEKKQRVRINVWLNSLPSNDFLNDDITNTVCYEMILDHAKAIINAGHINLIETFVEELADRCLAHNLVKTATVRIEKLDVFSEAEAVGVEITRHK